MPSSIGSVRRGSVSPGEFCRCELADSRPQQFPPTEPFHEWSLPDGRAYAAFYRVERGYLIRFPGMADFHVSADGTAAQCRPAPGVSEAVWRHLYLNQVQPLMLGRQGRLVFHGSAVEVPGGAVAFLGVSGRGKSTLAAAFASAGHRFLTDDGLHLERADGDYAVIPSHPSIRLWSDSREALLPEGATTMPPLPFTPKSRILAAAELPFCDEPRRLRAAYFLGEEQTGEIAFRRIGDAQAVSAWLNNTFVLDVEDRRGLGAHFEAITDLACTVPSYRLDYARRYDFLGPVRRSILEHAEALRSPSPGPPGG